jgi:hypothetical protein
MTRQYIVGGLRFTTEQALPELSEDGFSDLDIDVTFTNMPLTANLLCGPDGVSGSFDAEAETLLLQDQGDGATNAWLLRQMAPIVSSVSQRLVLHASAVVLAQGVVAFVGESGVGKSTLAEAFARPAADDLVPVRFKDAVLAPAGDTLHPLVAICFLDRADQSLSLERLSTTAALELEIVNGFGEHENPNAWVFQFDAYHRLAEDAPHYRLTIPNDLTAVPSVVRFIEASL